MSNNPVFLSTMRAVDRIFPNEPALAPASDVAEASPLADPERDTRVLSDGSLLDIDLYQISAGCWSAKDANHDARCGWAETREKAILDLISLCEDDLEDCEPYSDPIGYHEMR